MSRVFMVYPPYSPFRYMFKLTFVLMAGLRMVFAAEAVRQYEAHQTIGVPAAKSGKYTLRG